MMKKHVFIFALFATLPFFAYAQPQYSKGWVVSLSTGTQRIFVPQGQPAFIGLGLLGSGLDAVYAQPLDIQYFFSKHFGLASTIRWVDSSYDFAGIENIYKQIHGEWISMTSLQENTIKTVNFNSSWSIGPIVRVNWDRWFLHASAQVRQAQPLSVYGAKFKIVKIQTTETINLSFVPNQIDQARRINYDGNIRMGYLMTQRLGVFGELGAFKYRQSMDISIEEENLTKNAIYQADLRYDNPFWYVRWGVGVFWNLSSAK